MNENQFWPLSPPCTSTRYYLYPVNAFLTALGIGPDLFIFKVFTQGAGPRITFNAKYTSGHTKRPANLFSLQFMCLHFWCEWENHIGVNGSAVSFNMIILVLQPCLSSDASLICWRRNSSSPHGRSKVRVGSRTAPVKLLESAQELSAEKWTHAFCLKDYYSKCMLFQIHKWKNTPHTHKLLFFSITSFKVSAWFLVQSVGMLESLSDWASLCTSKLLKHSLITLGLTLM